MVICFLEETLLKHRDTGEACAEFATVSLCTAGIQSVTTLSPLCSVTDSPGYMIPKKGLKQEY